ncbi:MAG: hypothetical protein ABI876_17505, partial [Bacteroidota bacterium]
PAEPGPWPDSLRGRGGFTKEEVERLKALKISGYLQADWLHYDRRDSANGQAFYWDARKNLFTIRRGRIKLVYTSGNMRVTLQPDFTERGVVIKDAYGSIDLLPNDAFTVDVGLFLRPNFEVDYSSSHRESPERSQVTLAFYPGERDLGFMFSSKLNIADGFQPHLQLGMFNGEGTSPERDPYKDIIARVTLPLPFSETSPVKADVGASFYYGGIPQTDSMIVKVVNNANRPAPNDATGSWAGWGNKRNVNVEAQVTMDLLGIGSTMLRGEFMTGQRPTFPSSSKLVELRNQSGYYAYLIQNIGKHFQAVAKYDEFDRNTDLTGNFATSIADMKVGILGFGVNVFVDNLRVTLWYDIPTVAPGELAAKDGRGGFLPVSDIKDNKGTVRFQYRF